MTFSRRSYLQQSAAVAAGLTVPAWPLRAAQAAAATGPSQPDTDVLKQYRTPDWFGDAKFGIWSHWGPASVPGIGNSYPEEMYEQGSAAYNWHLQHYGHPSQVGYKDVLQSWKAEKFDPEALMGKYKAAGDKYFVALASHHDNFDNFASTYNPWNSVNTGPHKDIVGLWRQAALQNGLRFGVSWHADQRGWDYYASSYGSDKTGPLAGVPYDGQNTANASLYNPVHTPKTWPSQDWLTRWTKRQLELIDNYHPDLLYYDGGISFADAGGTPVAAHYLKTNAALHGGKSEGVINTKDTAFTRDYERGDPTTIRPEPWQCDTSLGGWFFLNDPIADFHSRSKNTGTVISLLADVVSKNGNLLMNFPQRGDDSLYPECETVLADLAQWTPINGEAIFGARPWLVSGEGPTALPIPKYLNELKQPLTAQDVRYTTKDGAVYAICLGVPTGKGTLTALGRLGSGIQSVALLGSSEPLAWTQEWEGLTLPPPSAWPQGHAVTFKIKTR